jgi:CBS domain-containing protein
VITADGGRGLGYAMIGLGTLAAFAGYVMGLWAALVGVFLVGAAAAERHHVELAEALGERTVGELMSATPMAAPAELPLTEARIFTRVQDVVPVVDDEGRAIGLLTSAGAAANRAGMIGDAAVRDPALLVSGDTAAAALLERAAFQRVGRAVVVDAAGRPLGVVSILDMERRLSARRPSAGTRPRAV